MKKNKDFLSRVQAQQVLIIGHVHDETQDGRLTLSRAAVEKLEHYTSVFSDTGKTMNIWLETDNSIDGFKNKGYNVEKIPLKTYRSNKLAIAYERVQEKVNQIIKNLKDLHLEKWSSKKKNRVIQYVSEQFTPKEIRLIKLWIDKTITSINKEIQLHIDEKSASNSHIKLFVVGNLHAIAFAGRYPTILIDFDEDRELFGNILYAIEKM